MMKKTVLAAFAVVICLCLVIDAHAQYQKMKVRVEINGDDASIVESYINRELRSLGDVQLVQNQVDADFQLIITALKTKTHGGKDVGYSMAVVYTFNSSCSDEVFPIYVNSLIWIIPPNEFAESSKKIVAQFDAECIENLRRGLRGE